MTFRYKYRGYWIKIESYDHEYKAVIWICSQPELKQLVGERIFSAGLAQVKAENYIDRVLSVSSVMG